MFVLEVGMMAHWVRARRERIRKATKEGCIGKCIVKGALLPR